MEPVIFRDVDAARAAFAMGRVVYRCLFCGRTHRSGGQSCIKQLAEQYGWKVPRPRVPPVPREIGLAYRFALRAYSSVRSAIADSTGSATTWQARFPRLRGCKTGSLTDVSSVSVVASTFFL